MFPATICQSWSRKEDSNDDHFSEKVSVQSRIQLAWETAPRTEAEARDLADHPPIPLLQLSLYLPTDVCQSVAQISRTFEIQEGLELFGQGEEAMFSGLEYYTVELD